MEKNKKYKETKFFSVKKRDRSCIISSILSVDP